MCPSEEAFDGAKDSYNELLLTAETGLLPLLEGSGSFAHQWTK